MAARQTETFRADFMEQIPKKGNVMNTETITRHFERIGARILIEHASSIRQRLGVFAPDGPLAIDVRGAGRDQNYYVVFNPQVVKLDVIQTRPKVRHLLLMARMDEGVRKEKFLCGHDERAWFVAAVPDVRGVSTVRTAMDALKPPLVRAAQERAGVRFRHQQRRRTKAFVRQGEWFFLPEPDFVPPEYILQNEPLQRGGARPHMCAYLCRTGGESVYVCRQHPNGVTQDRYLAIRQNDPAASYWMWRIMVRDPIMHVKGTIRHPDHEAIALPFWHRVVGNTETDAPAMRHVAFID